MGVTKAFRFPTQRSDLLVAPATDLQSLLEERDRALEDFLRFIPPPTLKFNQNGVLTVSGSDQDPMGFSGRLVLLAARLTTAGSSSTVASLKRGSTIIATFTFASSSQTPVTTVFTGSDVFSSSDYYWVDTTTVGTGAAGLVVAGWATAL